ncbi:MAG: ABC transporter ATP-binding protein [Pseudomonadota bacterium]
MKSFIWNWVLRFKSPLLLIAVLSILSSIATLFLPWFAAQFLGDILGSAKTDLFAIIIGLVALLSILATANILTTIATEHAAGKILAELRTDIYNHIQLLPLEFHNNSRHGDRFALITYQVHHLSSFLTGTLAFVPSLILTASGAILALLWIDPLMAWIVPLIVPPFFILTKMFGRRMRVASSKLRKAETDLIELADTNLTIVSAIKTSALERIHSERFAKAASKARVTALDEARLYAFLGPISSLVAACAVIVLLLVSSEQLHARNGEPAELFAFVLYAALLTRPLGELANVYGSYRLASSTLSRFKTVLSMQQEEGYSQAKRITGAVGNIEFEDVSFGYSGRPKLLDNFCLSIKAGNVVAITGDNGAGKSTLANLLLALSCPDNGRITLDGQDISKIQIQSLRRQFGYVPQRALLFNGTVADNITLGDTVAHQGESEGRIAQALRISQAEHFVKELPNGLDTIIGDNGVRLSGGQRQKIALARALLNDPPIYILDEATSMYDDDSEAAFIEACVAELSGRTVIVITHRPASLALADQIIRMDRGSVAGTPISPLR